MRVVNSSVVVLAAFLTSVHRAASAHERCSTRSMKPSLQRNSRDVHASNNNNDTKSKLRSTSIHHTSLYDLHSMRGGTIKSSSDATTTILKKQQTLNALHQTSFLIVISTSIVAFSPLPSLTRHLGSTVTAVTSPLTPQERAVKILSFLSAISAAIELFLSPLIGVWIDLKGRKRPSVLLYSLIAMANLGVVLYPSVGSICISRTVNVLIGGFLMIVANTVIADMFAKNDGGSDKMDDVHGKDQMGTVLGRQAASISLGFLSGSLLGGRLTELGERPAYGCAFLFSTLAALNASFRMVESVDLAKSALGSHEHSWDHASLKQKLLEAPLSSVQLLFHYGKRMRMLALLLLLQSAPIFMGDVFQMFAKEEWGLLPKDFGGIIALFGVLGIVSNMSLPIVLKSLGIQTFSLMAIASSLLFPITTILTTNYRYVLMAGVIGLYGGAQKVGTTTAMTSLASELGVPQGQLQGEKASMVALLKIGCPMIYGMLYLKGKEWSTLTTSGVGGVGLTTLMAKIGKKLPFLLNVLLGVIAFVVTWTNV
eukprot:scaffold2858_cov169-Alexandrium_tamarense.AAC.5